MKIILSTKAEQDIYSRKNLIKALQAANYEVAAITGKDKYDEKIKKELNIPIIDLDVKNTKTNIFDDLKLIRQYKKIFEREKPSVVLNFNIKPDIYGCIAASKLGIPSINNVTGLGRAFEKKGLLQFIVKRLYKKAFSGKHCFVFFQNPDDKNIFLKSKLIKEEKTDLLPGSGVDIDFFDSAKLSPPVKNESDAGKIRFAFIGRLVLSKGIGEYIKAAEKIRAKYPETVFYAAGGIYENEKDFISKAEIEKAETGKIIEYCGILQDMRGFLHNSTDCVVFPSYYREGVPRVLLEGGAMGKPLIACNTPGTKEPVIDGKNGFLCEAKNAENLAENIERFIRLSSKEKKEMGNASRKIITERFSEKIVIEKYLKKIKSFL